MEVCCDSQQDKKTESWFRELSGWRLFGYFFGVEKSYKEKFTFSNGCTCSIMIFSGESTKIVDLSFCGNKR
jgi:hypothetical protein